MDRQFAIYQSDLMFLQYKQDRKFTADFMPMQVAFHIWVHLDVAAKHDFNGLTPDVWQLGAVGAVRVAVRGLSASGSLLRPSQ